MSENNNNIVLPRDWAGMEDVIHDILKVVMTSSNDRNRTNNEIDTDVHALKALVIVIWDVISKLADIHMNKEGSIIPGHAETQSGTDVKILNHFMNTTYR